MATFIVTNTDATGAGSLREAIAQANLLAGADTVVFQAGVTGTIDLATTGSLMIDGGLTLTGPGAGTLTIAADSNAQIFDINSTSVPLFDASISGLTLTGVNGTGGAAIAAADVNLRLSGLTITGNVADPTSNGAGGVVFVSSGNLTIETSTITGNSGLTGGVQYGGTGNLTVRSSTISGNTGDATSGGGGGIDFAGADLTIDGSTISGNTGLVGGALAIFPSGTVSVRNSTFSGNTGDLTGSGGGGFPLAGGFLFVGFGNAVIEGSTFSGNNVGADGAGGLALFGPGTMTVTGSTISGNAGGVGGAAASFGTAVFTNLTVTNNAANGDPALIGSGGLLFDNLAAASLSHSTVVGNIDFAGFALAEDVVAMSSPLAINNSIIWTSGGGDDLYYEGVQITADYNLIGSYSNCVCTLPLAVLANLFGLDPMLGPLAANGGPVQTMLPLAGSPAINAGAPGHSAYNTPFTDARGFYRTVGRLDIGATEFGSTVFAGLPPLEPSAPRRAAAGPAAQPGPGDQRRFSNLLRFQTYGAVPPLPATVTTPEGKSLPNPLLAQQLVVRAMILDVDAGRLTLQQARDLMVDMADGTTSVATLSYQFFTGKIPTKEGLDYLVSSPQNPNDFNDGFYAGMSLENRHINMAVNLAKPPSPGAVGFASAYGPLSLADATAKAYAEIFGPVPAGKVEAILTPDRIAYFNTLGGDALGAKAAMVGWLLAESAKSDVGRYAVMNENFLYDAIDGVAAFGADLSIYLNAGPRHVGLVGMAEPEAG